MSAFLGPIHYWLFNKIRLQQDLVEALLKTGEEKTKNSEIRECCYEKYGRPVEGPLEELIDTGNIHGWLQGRIHEVEGRLAYCTTVLLKKGILTLEEMGNLFEQNGNAVYNQLEQKISSAEALYKVIFDYLLEGMPCDRINVVLEADESHVIWETTRCIHESYWGEVEGDVASYYALRAAWLKGFLRESGFVYKRMDQRQVIERG